MAAKKKNAAKNRAASKRATTASPKPGTTLERTYKGKTYNLRVTDAGFALGKRTFKSLTAAAKHVTQYKSINGVRFWLGKGDGK